MTRWVIDASVLLAAEDADDLHNADASRLLEGAGLVRADGPLLEVAARIAEEQGISVYDAAYVAAARASESQLVSCDIRELVSRKLALLPADALASQPGAS